MDSRYNIDEINLAVETEVLLIVGPTSDMLGKLQAIDSKFGQGTYILLLNGNLNAQQQSPEQEGTLEMFENVFCYVPVLKRLADGKDVEMLEFHECCGKWQVAEKIKKSKLEQLGSILKNIGDLGSGEFDYNTVWEGAQKPTTDDWASIVNKLNNR